MHTVFPLASLSEGQSGVIHALDLHGAMHDRLCDLGFTKGSVVTCLFSSLWGDPRAYRIRGSVIALRQSDAQHVRCCACGGES